LRATRSHALDDRLDVLSRRLQIDAFSSIIDAEFNDNEVRARRRDAIDARETPISPTFARRSIVTMVRPLSPILYA